MNIKDIWNKYKTTVTTARFNYIELTAMAVLIAVINVIIN